MQITETNKKLKYYIYEGTPTDRDETFYFATIKEARQYVKGKIALQTQLGLPWQCHIMLSKNWSFLESETRCTANYQEVADAIVREQVAKRKFAAAFAAADAKWQDSPEAHEIWQLACSGEQNAVDTAVEHGFKADPYSYPEFYSVAVGSIECLLSDHIKANDYRRTFFAQFNIAP